MTRPNTTPKPAPDVLYVVRARIDSGGKRGAPQLRKDVQALKRAAEEIERLRALVQEPLLPREQMTDEWLVGAMQRALSVSGCKPDDPAANVLRGFANRVLQSFGDRQGIQDALNIAYSQRQAANDATARAAA